MKTTIWCLMAVLLILIPGLSARDDEPAKHVTKLDLDEIYRLPTIKITQLVEEFLTLLDLEAMEKEISGLIEMDKAEKKAVRSILKEFRSLWTGDEAGDLTIEADTGKMKLKKWEKGDKLGALKTKARAALDEDDAAVFERWLDTRNQAAKKCSEKIARAAAELGRYGADIGRRAADIGRRAAEEAYRIPNLEHLFDGDWPNASEEMSRRIDEITRRAIDLSRISEDIADRITLKLEIPLNSSNIEIVLDDEAMGNLENVLKLKELDLDDLLKRFQVELPRTLPDFSLRLPPDQYRKAVEDYTKGIDYYRKGIGGYTKGIDAYTEAVSRASELIRERLEDRLSDRYELSREHWEAINKALREVDGILRLEKPPEKKAPREEKPLEEAVRIKNLKKELDTIRSRDKEIRDLKKEVEELKKELRRLKEEKGEGKV